MGVVNTYFQKSEKHRLTYKGRCGSMQIYCLLCRQCNEKESGDYNVVTRESLARQYEMIVCRMTGGQEEEGGKGGIDDQMVEAEV